MKTKLFLLFCLATVAHAATHTITTFDYAEANTVMAGATEAGAIVVLPSGPGTWSGTVTWNAPADATLIGAGTSATGGGDQTNITDGVTNGDPLLIITVAGTGTFRMTGITFESGSSVTEKNAGTISFGGPGGTATANIRIDHCHIDFSNVTANNKAIRLGPGIRGVLDSCILDFTGGVALYPYNGRGTVGNYEWTQPTAFGTADFFFVEDNIINGYGALGETRVYDGNDGAKMVVRFNTLVDCCLGEHHATGHSNDDRGPRASEFYCNSVTTEKDPFEEFPRPNNAAIDVQGGTALGWGNFWEDTVFKIGTKLTVVRQSSATYRQQMTPNAWGYAGPSPRATGTVNVSGTAVNWVSGDVFNTNWPAGTMIHIVGMTAEAVAGQEPADGPEAAIASVGSTTSLTLGNGGHTGSALTGATYTIGSAWDGHASGFYGYPVLDQPGRGAGDLLAGSFPDKLISGGPRNGTLAWPQQALEPVYFWANVGGVHFDHGGNYIVRSPVVELNRDVYTDRPGTYVSGSTIQVSNSSPFNGTATEGSGRGTGWGTWDNRPAEPVTPGVGYWRTDEGTWNTTTNNSFGVDQNGADGVLYVADASGNWQRYYEPYTYPHPLRASSSSGLNPPYARPAGRGAGISRRR